MQAILQNPFLKYLYGFFPTPRTLTLATISFAIGLVFGYGTLSFIDGDPSQLQQGYQDQWVISTEALYRNANNASAASAENIVTLLAQVDDPLGIVERLNIGDAGFRDLAAQAQEIAPAAPRGGGFIGNYVVPVLWIIAFAIAYTALFFVWAFVIWPFVRDRVRTRSAEEIAGDEDAKKQIAAIKEKKGLEEQMKAQAATSVGAQKYGEPVIQKISQYKRGFGKYDDSFNIETEDKTYFGETGGSVAERIGEDGVTAIEVWMFDKDEFTNTPNTILASQHAFNDPGVKSRLEPKGEVKLAEVGQVVVLETAALYVEAKVAAVEYDESAPVPNSEFKQVTTQITAWAKNVDTAGGGSGTPPSPAGLPPMPMPDTAATQPGAPAGGGFAPPPLGGGGATPPPDDPFGGTGDFTPVNPNNP